MWFRDERSGARAFRASSRSFLTATCRFNGDPALQAVRHTILRPRWSTRFHLSQHSSVAETLARLFETMYGVRLSIVGWPCTVFVLVPTTASRHGNGTNFKWGAFVFKRGKWARVEASTRGLWTVIEKAVGWSFRRPRSTSFPILKSYGNFELRRTRILTTDRSNGFTILWGGNKWKWCCLSDDVLFDFFFVKYSQPQWWGSTTNLFAFSPVAVADDAPLSNEAPVLLLLSLPSSSASWSPLLSPNVAELVLLVSITSPTPLVEGDICPEEPTPADKLFGCCLSSRCCCWVNPLLGGSSTVGEVNSITQWASSFNFATSVLGGIEAQKLFL